MYPVSSPPDLLEADLTGQVPLVREEYCFTLLAASPSEHWPV